MTMTSLNRYWFLIWPACFTFLLCSHIASANSASFRDSERLLNDVIDSYDHRVIPLVNQSDDIKVYVTFYLLGLLEIDEVKQEMKLNAWANFTWHDEIRIWNSSDYGGINVINPKPGDIWYPRVIITNSVEKRDLFKDNDFPTVIYSNGISRWYPGAVFALSCDLDMTYFPFDRQRCYLSIIGTDISSSLVLIVPEVAAVRTDSLIPNGEWIFSSYEITQKLGKYGDDIFSHLDFVLDFDRRPAFYVINIIVPITFLSFLSFFGFIIPEASGERSSFAITVLLALTVFLTILSSQVPSTSKSFPLILAYIFGLVLISGFSVIVIVVHYRIKTDIESWRLVNTGDGLETRNPRRTSGNKAIQNVKVEPKISDSTGEDKANEKTMDAPADEVKPRANDLARSVVQGAIRILKNGDVQMFLLFAFIWLVYVSIFLLRLVRFEDKVKTQ